MSSLVQGLQRLLDRALASSNASARELAELREATRHVSAAADRWREALERIARTVVMPGRDFTLSEVPDYVDRVIATCHREIKHVEAREADTRALYVTATKAQRDAELFAREAMKRLNLALSCVPSDDESAELATWWVGQPRKYGGGGESSGPTPTVESVLATVELDKLRREADEHCRIRRELRQALSDLVRAVASGRVHTVDRGAFERARELLK